MGKKKLYFWSGLLIVFFSIYYICYSEYLMAELPHLTWFNQLPLAEKFINNTLNISDMFTKYGEHGLLGNNILFLINVKFFDLTTMFDVWINDINVIVSGIIVSILFLRSINWRIDSLGIGGLIAINLFMFSITQYSSGGMETQVRLGLLFFLILMIGMDSYITENKYFIFSIIMIFISINIFGTMYSFAGILVVFLFLAHKMIIKRKISGKSVTILLCYVVSVLLYTIQYNVFSASQMSEDSLISGILNIFLHPLQFIVCLFSWSANAVLGWSVFQSPTFNANVWLVIGALVTATISYSIFLFFKNKMYLKTCYPIMMIVYSIGVFTLVYIGREAEWEWFGAYWYTVHTKVMLAGCVWILCYRVSEGKIKKVINFGLVALLFLTMVYANIKGLQRLPAEREYYLQKEKYLYIQDPEEMPVDDLGNTPLIEMLDFTMNSLEILRKYNLSVFSPRYQKNAEVLIKGVYEDGWCDNEVSIKKYFASGTEFYVEFYSPFTQIQNLTVYVDNEKIGEIELQPSNLQSFSYTFAETGIKELRITSDFEQKLEEPDERICSYILSREDIKLKDKLTIK